MAKRMKPEKFTGVAWMFFSLQILFYVLSPQNSASVCGVVSVLLCLPLMVSTWWTREKTVLWTKILTTVSLLLLSFPQIFFARKTVVLLDILLFFTLLVSLVFSCITAKKVSLNAISWLLELCYLWLRLIFRALDYSGNFSFWKIALVIGVLAGAAITVKWLWKGSRFWGRIGYFALCSFLITSSLWACIAHLNYALDFSEPQEYILVIEGKEHHRHRKSPDSYEFVFTVDGETFDLKVASFEYRTYAIGDTYRVLRYAGVFGEPFYISGEYLQ